MNIGFTGHRPNKLFGYNMLNKKYSELEYYLDTLLETIVDIAIERKEMHLCFYSGGALGFDRIAFYSVEKLKEKYKEQIKIFNVLAIPFKKQPIKWNIGDRKEYYNMIKKADNVYFVDTIEGYKIKGVKEGEFHFLKMANRNMFIIDNCDKLIACYNGTEGGTKHCIKNFIDKKRTSVLVINPKKLETKMVKNI